METLSMTEMRAQVSKPYHFIRKTGSLIIAYPSDSADGIPSFEVIRGLDEAGAMRIVSERGL